MFLQVTFKQFYINKKYDMINFAVSQNHIFWNKNNCFFTCRKDKVKETSCLQG